MRSLVDSGALKGTRGAYRLNSPVEALEVPYSVHAVLSARIDRLAEREKQVLQRAAVIGKQFAEPILAVVAALPAAELASVLATLCNAEFIHQESRTSVTANDPDSCKCEQQAFKAYLSGF